MRNSFIGIIVFSVALQISARSVNGPYSIIQRDANSRVWARTNVEITSGGVTVTNVHKYTELATGMHYTNSIGQWIESKEQIDILSQGGAAATQGQHKVFFPSDIYDGVLEVVTPDGRHLRSRPIGVSYDDGSNAVWVAILKHSTGLLVSSNKVMYPDAFNGLKADLVCTYRRSGFECDLVMRENPSAPGVYGLDARTSTLQLLTEFFDTADPDQIPASDEPFLGITDDTLRFGALSMVRGKAFVVNSTNATPSIAVYKHWFHWENRKFLMEQVPLNDLTDNLSTLPQSTNVLTSHLVPNVQLRFASNQRTLPAARPIISNTNQIAVALLNLKQRAGVVLDYDEVNSDQGNFDFASDTTYFISGGFTVSGATTFESGAVIKFSDSLDPGTYYYDPLVGTGNPVIALSTIDCEADTTHPVILTSMDDDSWGQQIDGSSGTPTTLSVPFLGFWEDSSLYQNLHFRYAGVGVIESLFNAPLFRNCEFLYCGIGVGGYGNVFTFENCLFAGGTGVEDPEYGDTTALVNVTMANSGYNFDIPETDSSLVVPNYSGPGTILNVTNSLFAGGQTLSGLETDVPNAGGTVNAAYSSDLSGSFNVGPGANIFYLVVGSPHRDAGTSDIDPDLLSLLETMTTCAPQDGSYPDTNTPDQGYHYPIISDADNDGLPDSWEYYWFGNYSHTGSELDVAGNSILSDYENYASHTATNDPNIIQFSIDVANNYVTTGSPTLGMNVSIGTPAYYSVLVDSTNFAGASWTSYTASNLTASTGSTQGWHEIWVGLKGPAPGATITWQWKRLKLDSTLPSLTVTNPVAYLAVQPIIEIQGYSSEDLGHISYDIANSTGLDTNEDVYTTDRFYDTNTFEFTTNYFQAFDVRLALGTNTITLHATDKAGNTTNVALNYTFDYSSKTPPVVSLYWPQDGTEVSGSSFTWRGHLDDFTAKVTATVSGNAEIFQGLVERTGDFWIENMSLADGANVLALTVTDVAGNIVTTNITVTKSALGLTIDPVSDDPWQDTVTVTGTIDTGGYTVWLNGVQATQSGTSWTASNVTNVPGGTAVFQARAIPDTDNGGSGSGGGGASPRLSDPGNPRSASAKDVESQKDKGPILVYVEHYNTTEDSSAVNTGPQNYNYLMTHNFSEDIYYKKGGKGSSAYDYDDESNYSWWRMHSSDSYLWNPPAAGTDSYVSDYDDSYLQSPTHTSGSYLWTPFSAREHCVVKKQDVNNKIGWPSSMLNDWLDPDSSGKYHRTADAKVTLFTGSKAILEESMWIFGANVNEIKNHITQPYRNGTLTSYVISYWPDGGQEILPKTRIKIGDIGTLEADGLRFKKLKSGTAVDVTIDVPGVDFFEYEGSPFATRYDLVKTYECAVGNTASRDVGVGEVVSYKFVQYGTQDGGLPQNASPVNWSASAGTVNPAISYSTTYTAPDHAAGDKVTVKMRGQTMEDGFSVLEPTGVDHTDIVNRDPYTVGKQGAGMHLQVYMAPTTVSFAHVQFEEVGENASNLSGWFAANGAPSHIGHGADTWFGVDCHNSWADHAWSDTYDPWISGGYTWDIPAKWRVGNNGTEHSLAGWNQAFSFSSDGTANVSKLGWKVTRHQNEVYGTASKQQ